MVIWPLHMECFFTMLTIISSIDFWVVFSHIFMSVINMVIDIQPLTCVIAIWIFKCWYLSTLCKARCFPFFSKKWFTFGIYLGSNFFVTLLKNVSSLDLYTSPSSNMILCLCCIFWHLPFLLIFIWNINRKRRKKIFFSGWPKLSIGIFWIFVLSLIDNCV